MADNRVIFEVITTSKGTKVVQRQTENLAKSVDKADRSTRNLSKSQEQNYGRQKQGVIQTANSTKNFSKLSQTIGGGSSGLVGAYATLAANIFAASAAFNFLRSSARFDVLTDGITELGNQSGRTLSVMADRLREVTGEAVSVEESFRSAALGVSGGFGEDELAGLAKIAKGASIALGRDLGDAFDRLTRGAIKLEPEILDELGIMVRLDEAVDNYATVLGKSATSLTQLERRQAFMNAILEQGEIKFGAIAEKVDTNPYDRLAAAFADLTRQIGKILNVAISPFVELLANNMGVLVASSLLLASTFAKQMVPSLLQGGKAAQMKAASLAQLARETKQAAIEQLKLDATGLGDSGVGSRTTSKELKAIEKSNGEMKVSNKLIGNLRRSKKLLENQEAKMQAAGSKYSAKEIADQQTKIANTEARINQLIRLQQAQVTAFTASSGEVGADLRSMQSEDIAGILDQQAGRTPLESLKGIPGDFKKIGESTKAAKLEYKNFLDEQAKGTKGTSTASRMFANLKFNAIAAGGGVRVLGAAFLNAIPVIGQIIFAVGLATQAFKWFTKNEPMERLNKSLEELDVILEGVTGKTEEFNRVNAQVKDPFQRLVSGYTVASGLIDETVSKLEEALKIQQEIDAKSGEIFEFAANDDISGALLEQLEAQQSELSKTLGVEVPINFNVKDIGGTELTNSPIFKVLAEMRNAPQIVQDVLNSKLDLSELVKNGAPVEEILSAISTALKETKEDIKDTGPALLDLQSEFKNTENVLSDFFNKAFPKTKFDEVAKQFNSLTVSFDTAIQKIEQSLGNEGANFFENLDLTNVSDDLAKQFAEATSGIGSNVESLLTGGVVDADRDLLASMEERDSLQSSINEKTKQMESANDVRAEQLAKELTKLYEKLGITEDEIAADKLRVTEKGKQIALLKGEFNQLQKNARENASLNKADSERIKKLKEASKFQGALEFTLLTQNKINARNRDALNDEITLLQKRADTKKKEGNEDVQLQAYINSLIVQRDQAEDSIKDKFEIQLELRQAAFKISQEELKIEKERAASILQNTKNELAILNYKRSGSTDLDPEQTFKAEVQAAKDKRDLAIQEINLRMAMLDVEASIVQARLQATAAEIKNTDPAGAALLEQAGKDVVANTGKARNALQASLRTISSSFEVEITNAMIKSLSGANTAQAVANVQTLIAERGANAYNKVVSAAGRAAYEEAIAAGVSEETAQGLASDARAGARDASGPGSASAAKTAAEQVTLGDAASMLGPQIAALKELGPEGELVAAATQGVFQIGNAFAVLGDSASTAGQKAAAGMQVLSTINGIMQANAKAQQAALDTEINAEKKRDGKSKESLAKIAAMEKKKEAIARKAFERNKKMQIASAIVDTASAVVGALGSKPWTPANIALAAAMGAMGMMQVGLIQKQQFQGGATDQPAVQNTALTIGGRSNAVDVSERASAGELAYLRGGRGVGTNANNFTPGAAMGRKGYADGADGITVGERGPEVITPAAPIDITPNYALGSGTTNVNFNISAVDGASVQNMLNEQQGNIIAMIRQAANDNGEGFLESVDPTVYGGTGG